ncbi:MAG: hypothetical protein Q9228_008024, partial [Teloschistes exilis]
MRFGIILTDNETRPAILEDFLSKTLAQGKYTVARKPQISEVIGLKGVQEGFNIRRKE